MSEAMDRLRAEAYGPTPTEPTPEHVHYAWPHGSPCRSTACWPALSLLPTLRENGTCTAPWCSRSQHEGGSVTVGMNQDAVIAAADLVGRTGATEFEIGYLHDDVPTEEAGWYAHVKYRGARITEEGRGPSEVAEALARRILTGARCKCGKLVALSGSGAVAYDDVTMADGTKWTLAEARAAGQCHWTRFGSRWAMGCE